MPLTHHNAFSLLPYVTVEAGRGGGMRRMPDGKAAKAQIEGESGKLADIGL